jgi:hypothetical protein
MRTVHNFISGLLFGALLGSAFVSNYNGVVVDDLRPVHSTNTPKGQDNSVYRVRYFDKDAKSKFSAGPYFDDDEAFEKSRSLSQNNRIRLKSIRIQSLTPGNDSWQKVAD